MAREEGAQTVEGRRERGRLEGGGAERKRWVDGSARVGGSAAAGRPYPPSLGRVRQCVVEQVGDEVGHGGE